MNTKDLECRLAQAQLARYVAGEELAAELVADLEAHLAECAECHAAVEARRNVLAQRLFRGEAFASQPQSDSPSGDRIEPYAAVEMVARLHRRGGWLQSWVEVLSQAGSRTASAGSARKWRPLALSLLLSGLLIAMTAMAKNPNSLFGERVAPTTPIAERNSAGSLSDGRPMPMASRSSSASEGSAITFVPNAENPTSSGGSSSLATAPSSAESENSQTRVSAPREVEADSGDRPTLATGKRPKEGNAPPSLDPAARPNSPPSPARNTARPRVGARTDVGSIRVYDSNGNPIRP